MREMIMLFIITGLVASGILMSAYLNDKNNENKGE